MEREANFCRRGYGRRAYRIGGGNETEAYNFGYPFRGSPWADSNFSPHRKKFGHTNLLLSLGSYAHLE